MLNPNCSESVYKLSKETLKEFNDKELETFKNIISRLQTGEFSFDVPPIYLEGEDFEFTPYFEKWILDIFLDYFEIEAERNHWTCGATSYLSKEQYDELVKKFCDWYSLEYKDMYERRYKEDE
jgi:hypothetical protein